jgi:hypothetical protein
MKSRVLQGILLVGLAFFTLNVLFPPYQLRHDRYPYSVIEYHFFLTPPDKASLIEYRLRHQGVAIVLVTATACLGYLVLRRRLPTRDDG